MFPGMATPPANVPGYPGSPAGRTTNLPPMPAPRPIPPPSSIVPPTGNVPPPTSRPLPLPPSPQSKAPPTSGRSPVVPTPKPVPSPIPKPASASAPQPMSFPGGPGAAAAVGPGPAVRPAEPPEETDAATELKTMLRKNSVPLGVSFIVHFLLIILLGLLTVGQIKRNGISLQASINGPTDAGNLADFRSFDVGEIKPLDTPDEVPLFTPQVKVTVNVPVSPFGTGKVAVNTSNISAPSALAGRGGGIKGTLLGQYGGGQDTEDAVGMALVWLARHQQPSGLWSLTGTDGDAKSRYSKGSSYENHEAATAMALLAFLGAGNTHKSGEYAKVVDKAAQALLRLQDPSGNFFRGARADDALYCQAQCTMAMCELYALTKDSALKDACIKAVKFIIDAQDPDPIKGGGWRYRPRSDSDTSVTGWMVMALQSARNAGLEVPQDCFDRISFYLDKAALGVDMLSPTTTVVTINTPGIKKPTNLGSKYAYQPGLDFDRVMTAEGLLCRMYLGWSRDDPRLIDGCNWILSEHLPTWPDRDVYYWYYATQTMFHMEGNYWKEWNNRLKEMLVFHQEKAGPERGSWDPLDNEGPDLWSLNKHGGRLYVTCLSVYMLEVYYRHLPLYSELKKQIEAQNQKKRAAASS